tara:strand:+ start:12 stop:332 length:321 start_codon:yes stop_codon:yes gene_type:complete
MNQDLIIIISILFIFVLFISIIVLSKDKFENNSKLKPKTKVEPETKTKVESETKVEPKTIVEPNKINCLKQNNTYRQKVGREYLYPEVYISKYGEFGTRLGTNLGL